MDERTTETPETGAGPKPGRLPPEPDRPYTAPSDGKGVWMKGAPREEPREGFAARSALSREPLTRTERLLVTMLVTMFVTMFAAMLGAGALGFTAISGQLLDMQKQIGGLRTDLQTEIGDLRTDLQTEIGDLRTDMQKQIGGVRTEIGDLRAEMQKQIGELSERMGELSERMTRVETLIQTR